MDEREIKEFLEGSEQENDSIKKVNFPQLKSAAGADQIKISLDYLNDIPAKISAKLGSSKVKVCELLKLEKGAILELDKPAGETVDMYINQQLFGRAEVIIIGSNFGLRVDRLYESETAAGKDVPGDNAGE